MPGNDTLPGVVHNCRGSRAEALAYAASLALWQRRLAGLADVIVVPSRFAAGRLRELGAPLPVSTDGVRRAGAADSGGARARRGLGAPLRAGRLPALAREGSGCRRRGLPARGDAPRRRGGRAGARSAARFSVGRVRGALRRARRASSAWPSCVPGRRSPSCRRARPRPSGSPLPSGHRWPPGCAGRGQPRGAALPELGLEAAALVTPGARRRGPRRGDRASGRRHARAGRGRPAPRGGAVRAREGGG